MVRIAREIPIRLFYSFAVRLVALIVTAGKEIVVGVKIFRRDVLTINFSHENIFIIVKQFREVK